MKLRYVLSLALSLCFMLANAQIKTPAASPGATVMQKFALTSATVEYSRPSVKKRKIFGALVPWDKPWRTGANKITNLTVAADVKINGQNLPAGTYGWVSIPGQDEWTIALNSDSKQWGAYEYDAAKDVLRFKVKPERLTLPVENMHIYFDNITEKSADVVLEWENTRVRFTLEQDPHEIILAAIKEATAKPDCSTDDYFTAAEYYLDHNLDLKKALEWANKVIEKDQNWWSYYLRANVEHKLGMCKEATADAEKSLEGAKKDGDTSYVNKNQAIIDACKGK